MRKKLLLISLAAAFIGLCAYSGGPGQAAGLNRTGSQGSTPGCGGGCHDFSANTAVTIEVDSLTFPVTHYTAGFTYTIKIHGTNSISQPAFGFQFSAVSGVGVGQVQAGTFSSIPANAHTVVVNGLTLVEHSSAISSAGGIYTEAFSWTAPAAGTGTVSLYVALNAVNLNGNNSGDEYNFTSSTLTENVCALPVITTGPVAQTVCSGASVTFSVTTSSPGVTYQWQYNNGNISGATNSTYNIPSVVVGNAGNYRVVLTNSCGNTTSTNVALTVNTAPTISTQPQAVTACAGSAATFSVTTTTPGVTYQWQYNTGNISGATNSTYTIPTVGVANAGTYNVVITNSCGSVTSNTVTLTVNTLPVITTQPLAQTVCSGAAVSFSVATSTPSVTYQWQVGNNPISGATNATYTIPSAAVGNTGNYNVLITNSCGTTTSNTVALTVNTAPVITTQPQAVTACSGAAATFSVVSTTPGTTYQWQYNTGNISGATNSSYTIPSVAVANAGTYNVVLTNTCGSTTSNTVTLTVNTLPVITTQPVGQTICSGAAASFSVATSTPGVSYQWQYNSGNIGGATNSSYNIASALPANSGTYNVVLTNSCGSVTSNTVTLTVNTLPVITAQPVPQSVCSGSTASFSVTTTTPGVTYQWQFGNNPISGATNSTLSIPSAGVGNVGNYNVVLTNSCGTTTSNTVALSLNQPPILNTQPQSQTLCAGAAVTFSVSTSTPGVTYQWNYNSNPISGATNNTLGISPIHVSSSGSYNVVVTNGCGGSTTSNTAVLTVDTLPVISTQPVAQTACAGTAVTFSVVTTSPNTTYQWKFGINAISGATNNTYTIPSVAVGNAGNYSVVLTDDCGTTTSTVVALTVNTVPTITTQPIGDTLCVGNNVSLSVTSPTPGVTYQWQYNNGAIGGATNSNYNINGVIAANAGSYNVVITNGCGSVTSNTVLLGVNTSTPVITIQPVAADVCVGGTAFFDVVSSSPGVTYQWQFNSNDIAGATNHSYSIAGITFANAGSYDVVITNSCGNTTSVVVPLNVYSAPTITTQPLSQTICAGSPVTFFISNSEPVLSYQWRLGVNAITGASDSVYTIAQVHSGNAGNYTIIVTNACGTVTSTPAILTVDSLPIITTEPIAQSVCAGNGLSMSLVATGGTSYQWSLNNSAITGATNATYSIASATNANAGNYSAIVANNCGSSYSDTVALTVNPLPVPVITETGLVLTTGAFSTYQWIKNGTDISAATQSSYTVSVDGTYQVRVTDGNGCTGTSDTVIISGLGVKNLANANGIEIYPNPAQSVVNIDAPGDVNVVLKDLAGKAITEEKHAKKIDLSKLPNGVYMLTISNDLGQVLMVQKLVKE
jgi:hypothetical protein